MNFGASTSAATPLRVKEMRPEDIREALARDPRLIVPVGTCEAFGAHMPLGAGTIIVERLADDISANHQILRAPTLEYGVTLEGHAGTPGSAGIRRKTLHRMLNDLISSWESAKIHQFVFLTANGYEPHLDALSTVLTSRSQVRVVDILSTGIDHLLEGQSSPLKGDEADTSLLMHIAPSLAGPAIHDHTFPSKHFRRYRRGAISLPRGSSSVSLRPSLATAEKGHLIYERIYERVVARVIVHDVASELEPDEPEGSDASTDDE
jgi:creatinine amidohydrolase